MSGTKPLNTSFLIKAILIIFSCFFQSCDPEISFDEPQPGDGNGLLFFPKSIRGQYANQKDNSILSIQEKEIYRTYLWNEKQSIKSLDSNYRLTDSTIVSLDGKEKIPVYVVGDSFSMKSNFFVDTVFKISENNVLKKFKGNYFLNKKTEKNLWAVTSLSFNKGIISTGKVTIDNIKRLQEISESADTTIYNFKVTPQQFKKFIIESGFSDKELFMRIKKG